jgi:hypothetical protein
VGVTIFAVINGIKSEGKSNMNDQTPESRNQLKTEIYVLVTFNFIALLVFAYFCGAFVDLLTVL